METKQEKILNKIMEEGLESILPSRMEEVLRRLFIIHELRWQIGSMYPGANLEENEKYYDANEFLNEAEKRTWAYGKGEQEEL